MLTGAHGHVFESIPAPCLVGVESGAVVVDAKFESVVGARDRHRYERGACVASNVGEALPENRLEVEMCRLPSVVVDVFVNVHNWVLREHSAGFFSDRQQCVASAGSFIRRA